MPTQTWLQRVPPAGTAAANNGDADERAGRGRSGPGVPPAPPAGTAAAKDTSTTATRRAMSTRQAAPRRDIAAAGASGWDANVRRRHRRHRRRRRQLEADRCRLLRRGPSRARRPRDRDGHGKAGVRRCSSCGAAATANLKLAAAVAAGALPLWT